MTQLLNIERVASLQPDYLGFIFYDKSPRNITLPSLPKTKAIAHVGVFVNASLDVIKQKATAFNLDVIQLHGDETPAFCDMIKKELPSIKIWKAFGVGDRFDFNALRDYVPVVDSFLFDTKTVLRGGSGTQFDWQVLNNYTFKTPIIISGGIGLEQIAALTALFKTELPIEVIDLNSRFEEAPGLKDYNKLKTFFDAI
ncbi:MAG: phosphoribosylanthranilate isomerase [Gilvibacter sp.]